MNEEVEKKEILNLDYLKNLLIVLNNCESIDDINQIIGERIQDLIPDSFIIISISDENREYSEVKKIFGLDKTLNVIKKFLKYDPYEFKYPIRKASLKELEIYTSGKLFEFENGLYEITNRTIPKVISRTLEKMHDVKKTYGIGYSQNGIIYGTIAILTHKEIENSKRTIIESMVSQASLIIQKKFIEKNLKQSEDKYKLITENIGLAIYLFERDGRMIYTNSIGVEFVKKKKEEMLLHNINEIFPKAVVEKIYPDIITVIDTNKQYEGEREYIFNGKARWFSTKIQPLYDSASESTVALVISEDITEKKINEQELIKLTKELRESEKLKTEFLANFSHEIRSLMNGILGFAQLIKGTDLKTEKDEYSDIIIDNSNNLLKLFNNIIDIAKIEAGSVNMEIGEFGLNKFLDDIYNIFKVNQKIQTDELELKLVKETKDIILKTDEIKFRQIFINLIDNAIKFTDKGTVEYGYKVNTKNEKVYYVKDTGIGISKENQEMIFKRFYQGEDINTRRYNGAGIGLSLVKSYAKVLKGNIWLESEKGNGTTFFFTIPN
jgi:PAS domain S-box-containing protein